MKKKFIGVIVLLAAGVSGSTLLYQGGIIQASTLNDIQLANVEALVSSETGSGETCYHTITSKPGSKVLYCATCTYVDKSTYSWVSSTSTCP